MRTLPLLVLSLLSIAGPAISGASAPTSLATSVLILTDASGSVVNGDTHVSDLIAAFTTTGASITTNTTELTNGSAMLSGLVTGWDVVIIVTVSGQQIDAADIPVLQGAVNAGVSRAFIFFTDACNGCTAGSANAVLPIVNTVGGWSASLGSADNTYPFVATLNGAGPYNAPFAGLPTILAGAYSPLVGVPAPNVIYTVSSFVSGPMAVIAPSTGQSACVFMATDVTEFWVTGGTITSAQANALATDFLNAAGDCAAATAAHARTWGSLKALYR